MALFFTYRSSNIESSLLFLSTIECTPSLLFSLFFTGQVDKLILFKDFGTKKLV